AGERIRSIAIWAVEALAAFFVILMARHNWKKDRADHQGAWRLAAARFLLAGLAWVGWTHPIDNADFIEHFLAACSDWLLSAAVIWMIYLALEPAVRSRWPHSIVTWNRVLAGRWLDAQVGSDILVGAAVGSAIWVAFKLINPALGSHGEP